MRRRSVLDTEQLLLAFEVTEEEIEQALAPGAVFAIETLHGPGRSRYRLDWVHQHPDNHPTGAGWVTCALTLLGGSSGGAMVGPDALIPAEHEGRTTWGLKKPTPHLGTRCLWADLEHEWCDTIEKRRAEQ